MPCCRLWLFKITRTDRGIAKCGSCDGLRSRATAHIVASSPGSAIYQRIDQGAQVAVDQVLPFGGLCFHLPANLSESLLMLSLVLLIVHLYFVCYGAIISRYQQCSKTKPLYGYHLIIRIANNQECLL